MLQASTSLFRADEYSKYKYFFLDNTYRKFYIKKYAPQSASPEPPPRVTALSVWRSCNRTGATGSKVKNVSIDSTLNLYRFEELERNRHYTVDEEEGWIRFVDSVFLQPSQMVTLFMRTSDSLQHPQLQKGNRVLSIRYDSLIMDSVQDTLWSLWILHNMVSIDSAIVDTSRFYLPWRNVYRTVSLENVSALIVKVLHALPDKSGYKEKNSDEKWFSDILGISENGKPLVQNHQIYNRQHFEIVLPPFDTTDVGLEPFNNPALGEYRDSMVYRYSEDWIKIFKTDGRYFPQFVIEVTSFSNNDSP